MILSHGWPFCLFGDDQVENGLDARLLEKEKVRVVMCDVNIPDMDFTDFVGFRTSGSGNRGVDASPMEGFDPDKVDEILWLRELNLKSSTLVALGYRNENEDWLVKLKKSP